MIKTRFKSCREESYKWFVEYAELETMTLGIVRKGGNAQFVEMKVIMPSLVHTRGDVACVVAMNTMLATAPPGNINISSS